MLLAGKCAIVTGAGRGLGKAVVRVFAREGARAHRYAIAYCVTLGPGTCFP